MPRPGCATRQAMDAEDTTRSIPKLWLLESLIVDDKSFRLPLEKYFMFLTYFKGTTKAQHLPNLSFLTVDRMVFICHWSHNPHRLWSTDLSSGAASGNAGRSTWVSLCARCSRARRVKDFGLKAKWSRWEEWKVMFAVWLMGVSIPEEDRIKAQSYKFILTSRVYLDSMTSL